MAQSLQQQVKVAGRRFAKRRGITLATLGLYALNNARFFPRLEEHDDCTVKAWQKMMRYIERENARLDAEKEAKRNG